MFGIYASDERGFEIMGFAKIRNIKKDIGSVSKPTPVVARRDKSVSSNEPSEKHRNEPNILTCIPTMVCGTIHYNTHEYDSCISISFEEMNTWL